MKGFFGKRDKKTAVIALICCFVGENNFQDFKFWGLNQVFILSSYNFPGTLEGTISIYLPVYLKLWLMHGNGMLNFTALKIYPLENKRKTLVFSTTVKKEELDLFHFSFVMNLFFLAQILSSKYIKNKIKTNQINNINMIKRISQYSGTQWKYRSSVSQPEESRDTGFLLTKLFFDILPQAFLGPSL